MMRFFISLFCCMLYCGSGWAIFLGKDAANLPDTLTQQDLERFQTFPKVSCFEEGVAGMAAQDSGIEGKIWDLQKKLTIQLSTFAPNTLGAPADCSYFKSTKSLFQLGFVFTHPTQSGAQNGLKVYAEYLSSDPDEVILLWTFIPETLKPYTPEEKQELIEKKQFLQAGPKNRE